MRVMSSFPRLRRIMSHRSNIQDEDGYVYRFVTLPAVSLDDELTVVFGEVRGRARGDVIWSIFVAKSLGCREE